MNKNFILTLNCGSSSIKFSIFNINNINNSYINGKIDLIDSYNACVYIYKKNYKNIIKFNCFINYENSISYIFNCILEKENLKKYILCIGHRVVHGGNKFKNSVIIKKKHLINIKSLIKFSPIHNPINIIGIEKSIYLLPEISNNNIAVFDTSFYYSIPYYSYLYAIPINFYKKYNIRRYGAHGISHNYVLNEYSNIFNINIKKLNLISCHLGNGSSISAIKNGKCIDTSMGLTPLEGLVMGTRCGDIDPYIIFYLNKFLNFSISEIENILLNKSGILGLTNKSNDLRIIEDLYKNNNKESIIAINVFCYRLLKYIYSYIGILSNNIDGIIFTGGIGENSSLIRKLILDKLNIFGVYLNKDKNKNKIFEKNKLITNDNSKIKSIVIKTNEELFIAKEAFKLITYKNK